MFSCERRNVPFLVSFIGTGMVAIGSKRAGGNGAGNTLARDVEGEVDLERSVGIETESGSGEGTDVTTVLLSR